VATEPVAVVVDASEGADVVTMVWKAVGGFGVVVLEARADVVLERAPAVVVVVLADAETVLATGLAAVLVVPATLVVAVVTEAALGGGLSSDSEAVLAVPVADVLSWR
jgi:hypothetical protein